MSLHGRGARGHAVGAAGCNRDPRAKGGLEGQCAVVGDSGRAEGGSAGCKAGNRNGRGARALAGCAAERVHSARLGGDGGMRGADGERLRRTRMVITSATTCSIEPGTRSPVIESGSRRGSMRTFETRRDFAEYLRRQRMQRRRRCRSERCVFRRRNDDGGRGAHAARTARCALWGSGCRRPRPISRG